MNNTEPKLLTWAATHQGLWMFSTEEIEHQKLRAKTTTTYSLTSKNKDLKYMHLVQNYVPENRKGLK